MKAIKLYSPVILQALLILIGFLIVSTLSARETQPAENSFTYLTISEQEDEQKLEDWMLDASQWNCSETEPALAQEDEIKLEDWMLDPNDTFWTQNLQFALSVEEEITIENWMTDSKHWLN